QTTHEEKQAKAARRASKASHLPIDLPGPQKIKDHPSKVNALTKKTYSVTVRRPGASNTSKWHIVAYFSASDSTRLPVVDNYDYLRCIRVPHGVFTSTRTTCSDHDRFPSHSDEFDSTRGSQSPVSPSFELRSPRLPPPRFHGRAPEYPLLLPPPAPPSRETNARVSPPPLSSHAPKPPVPRRRSTSPTTRHVRARLSPEDRRILDRFRVVL
ncbi:hypothetical protein B0H14DRAFT_2351232, partial [Mycena olivaceomarginata]